MSRVVPPDASRSTEDSTGATEDTLQLHPSPHPRILIVDDGLAERLALKAWLDEIGFLTLLAPDGAAALELLDDPTNHVDLVILDLNMHGLHGLEVLRAIRTRHSRTELPVVVVSGEPDHDRVIEAFHHGANDFIAKPVIPDELEARLEAHLAVRAEARLRMSGGHKRLTRDATGNLSAQPHASTSRVFGMCHTCLAVVALTDERCPDCDLATPRMGWSAIDRSHAPHLARIVGGRYLLDKTLGTGSTGIVYRGRDLELNQRFAIKVISLPTHTPDALERLQAEVSVMTTVHNPHVVHVYEVLQLDDHTVALVTNFIDGLTLAEMIRKHRRIPPRVALEIIRQVAQGLHAVHSAGMIHRDVKPFNIMVETLPGGYFAHILDFGIAVALQEAIAPSSHFQGTPLYAAPEQSAGNHTVDVRADIYSLGVTLYEMLAGAPPFSSTSILSLFMQHQHRRVPSLPSLTTSPSVRFVLDGLVHAALEKNAADRIPSMQAFIARVDEALVLLQSKPDVTNTDDRDIPAGPHPNAITATTLVDARTTAIRQLFSALPTVPDDALLAVSDRFHAIAIRHDGPSRHNTLTHFDFARADVRRFDVLPDTHPTALALDPTGSFAVVGTRSGHAIGLPLLPRPARQFDVRLSAHAITALAFAQDGKWIAAAAADGHIFMLSPNATSGVAVSHIDGPIKALGFANTATPVAITAAHGVAALVGDTPPFSFTLADDADILHAAFDRDGTSVLMLTTDGLIVRIALASGQIVEQLHFADHNLRAVACTAEGVTALAEVEGHLELWALESITPC